MAPEKRIRNVTLVGANGTVGAPILSALLAAGHKTAVLTRPGSSASFPPAVTVHVRDYNDVEFIEGCLRGQDVLVMALAFNAYDAQIPLIKAAARAGVPYVVPCEFGSDPTHPKLNAEINIMNMKAPFRKLIEELGVSSWIGVVNNLWVEFTLRLGLYGIDLKKKTATLYDEGDVKGNFTTLTRVGEALAALLALPEAELSRHRNAFVYFSSFYVSQRDLLASAMRATGTAEGDWAVASVSSDKVIRDAKAPSADPMAPAMSLFALMFKHGYGGDYNTKLQDYESLGLPAEDLDAIMKSVAQELGA
ncbi:putative isoflavone reductase family protein [Rosellinia necatrix]|uniref:Putative isoflavone reductase family protein n=1 Tax=Rosellinia necatrix TaxID=77044 RepID=A0A1W2TE59_ROSNE|nr:putative isoflavone reductase family protein [Rosellinia necatrix]